MPAIMWYLWLPLGLLVSYRRTLPCLREPTELLTRPVATEMARERSLVLRPLLHPLDTRGSMEVIHPEVTFISSVSSLTDE